MFELKGPSIANSNLWINDDVRPIESQRRTWGFFALHNYMLLSSLSISSFFSGSALIPLGLTWWQSIICIVLGNLVSAAGVYINSIAGLDYHIGFPVLSRAAWGMWGSLFTIWNRIFLAIVWYSVQAFVGGQCFYLILLSWDLELEKHIPNTMPSDIGMTTAQFVAYILFMVFSLPFHYIQPHRLQTFLNITSIVIGAFFTVFLIWALATMGPHGFGDTITDRTPLPATGGPQSVVWIVLYGISSTVGAISAGILNGNDYTRLSNTRRGPWAVAFSLFFYTTLCSVAGILVVAATQERLGGPEWNPAMILQRLVELNPTAGTRAAIFFAGLTLAVGQLGINISGNGLSGGIDLSAILPKYIDIRRGAYVTALLSPVVNPWRLVGTASIFLSVVAGYSVFLAPMVGIMVVSYFVVCKRKLDIDSLFTGNSASIYWYTCGVNWRALFAVSSCRNRRLHDRVANAEVCCSGWLGLYLLSQAFSHPSALPLWSQMVP